MKTEDFNKKKRILSLKGKLQAENTLAITTNSRGRTIYIKGCYSCATTFQATRADALTCSDRCKASLSRRLAKEFPPLVRFKEKDKIEVDKIGDLGQYKKKF